MPERAYFCPCWSGLVGWPVRRDDRYCCLCGRRFTNVTARSAVLVPGPRPILALYLLPEEGVPAGRVAGRLEFDLEGLYAAPPQVRWRRQEGIAARVEEQHQPAADRLSLYLSVEDHATTPSGPAGKANLEVILNEEIFPFDIHLYLLDSQGGVGWMHQQLDHLSAGRDYVIYREAVRGKLFLHYLLDRDTPLQWEGVECEHPAAEVVLLEPDHARPTLRAQVNWTTTHLRRDVEEETVTFRIKVRGLDGVTLEQRMLWRLRHPLACQPAGLSIPVLTRGQNQFCVIQLTNIEHSAIRLESVTAEPPWIVPAQAPVYISDLRQGESGTILLELRPDEIADGPGPHTGEVRLVMADRGEQIYPVSVQIVRSARRIEGPLLLDPGPPRIGMAFLDPAGFGLGYLRGSGSGGLDAEQLGLDAEEYLAAVRDTPTFPPIGDRLPGLARAFARRQGLNVQRILLCRQPWMDGHTGLAGDELIDWAPLFREGVLFQTRQSPGATCVRMDAWATYFVLPSASGPPQVRRARGGSASLGTGVVRCLLRQWKNLAQTDVAQLQSLEAQNSDESNVGLWLPWACEALLADYRWSPDYAWRGLLGMIGRILPSTRGRAFDVSQADRSFAIEVRNHVRRIAEALRKQVAPAGGVQTCAIGSALFGCKSMAAAIESYGRELDWALTAVPYQWLAWLARSERERAESAAGSV